jgi:pimeloyl-ACP methyl ester carboxylesterase
MERRIADSPDVAKSIDVGGIATNYHDAGTGRPVILLHGSGPGVTAWQNWQRIIPRLALGYRVLAPDIVGFGFTPLPDGREPNIKLWLEHLTGFIEALGLDQVTLVGNSFGGALALAMMARNAQRVKALVLMGTPAGEFEQSGGLADSYAFEPTLENMEAMMKRFPYDPAIITREMVEARFAVAEVNSGLDTIRKLQPEPAADGKPKTVRGVPFEQLDAIDAPALILHGREDKVIPLEIAVRVHQHLANSQLHVFGKCGHWVQVEHEQGFLDQLEGFLEDTQ